MKEQPWYEDFGFKINPFMIKPAAFHDEMIGYEEKVDRLTDELEEGSVWFLGGKYGTGKTTALKRIINTFMGQGKLIYLSLNRSDRSIDFHRLLKRRGNIIQKLLGLRPKDCTLLVDEAQRITSKDCDNIIDLYDSEHLKSIVFVSNKYDKVRFTDELKELIGKNIMHVGEITPDEAVDLARKRIGDVDFVSNKLIKKIFEKSKNNPRKFLQNLEEVFRLAHSEGAKKITENHIKKA